MGWYGMVCIWDGMGWDGMRLREWVGGFQDGREISIYIYIRVVNVFLFYLVVAFDSFHPILPIRGFPVRSG